MNVVLTAGVLPHTPSNINNLLSVILLDQKNSNQKIWAACFVTKFQNCKFLGMFKDKQLTVSRYWSITFWYPEDGPLPDIESRVVHDSELNGQKVFAYETAEFTEHPAKYLKSSDNKSSMVPLKNPVFQIQNALNSMIEHLLHHCWEIFYLHKEMSLI